MPPLDTLPMFVGAALVLLVIPGPAVLFIVARSSAHGVRAGAVSVLGVHAASVVHVLAAVAGCRRSWSRRRPSSRRSRCWVGST